jgi:hypothetical protein
MDGIASALTLRRQNINPPQLGDDLFGLRLFLGIAVLLDRKNSSAWTTT